MCKTLEGIKPVRATAIPDSRRLTGRSIKQGFLATSELDPVALAAIGHLVDPVQTTAIFTFIGNQMITKTNQTNDPTQLNADRDHTRSSVEHLSTVASSAKDAALKYGSHYVAEPAKDLFGLLQDYAKSRPEVAAVWCFGIGLVLGWKLRP